MKILVDIAQVLYNIRFTQASKRRYSRDGNLILIHISDVQNRRFKGAKLLP